MAVEVDPTQLGVQAGGGFVIGGVIGFAAKKIVKLVALLAGLQLAVFAYLDYQGIVTVDWSALQGVAAFSTSGGESGVPPVVTQALSATPLSGGFAAGTALGFKKG